MLPKIRGPAFILPGITLCGKSCKLFPFSAAIAKKEEDNAADPVDNHGDPDADGAHSEIDAENVGQHNPEEEHGSNGNDHRIADIVAGAQHVRENKGERPQKYAAARVNDNELPGQRRCFCREPEDGENRIQEQNECTVKNKRGQIGDQKNFLQIKPDLPFRACTDALPMTVIMARLVACPMMTPTESRLLATPFAAI